MILVFAGVGKNIKSATDNKFNSMAYLYAIACGVFYSLAFPPFNISYLTWIAFVPLFVISSPSISRFSISNLKLKSFSLGYVAGFIANLVIFYWLWDTFHAAGLNRITTFSCWIALAGLMAVYFGVFKLLVDAVPHGFLKYFFSAALWVCLEEIKGFVVTGFPWALLSHSQVHHLYLIQISSVFGSPVLSFLIIAVNMSIVGFISSFLFSVSRLRSAGFHFIFISFLVLSTVLFGFLRVRQSRLLEPNAKSIKVALLQGNVDQYSKWDDSHEMSIRKTYYDLIQQTLKEKVDLIIWPESSIPGWIPNEPFYMDWLKHLVEESAVPSIVGAVSQLENRHLNSAFLFSSTGDIQAQYSKQHLVPFGEYVPFGKIFSRWIPYLGQLGQFDRGRSPVMFSVRDMLFSPSICYEAIFPRLMNKMKKKGAQVFVNITNDGWFLGTSAPEQHFNTNILRAVENGIPLVRVANTGISGIISPVGEVVCQTPLLTKQLVIADLKVYSVKSHFSWGERLFLFFNFLLILFVFLR
ncbi:MAG: apolipoprotein N-acyltransferase [Elusimicrobiota bacterium]